MTPIKVMKGKTYGKDANKFSEQAEYIVSTKYDGHLIQIHQDGDRTAWFTSNGKPFHLDIAMPHGNYIMIAEFMYGCEGKLGDRRKSAILTTLRTAYSKGECVDIDLDKVNIKVFDLVSDEPYRVRLERLSELVPNMVVPSVKAKGVEAVELAKMMANEGWEGVVLRGPDDPYQIGKRVHHMIKMKFRKTADLLCIDVEEGQGKCQGIGALVLQDSEGRIVKVGSGLDYSVETRQGDQFIGKVIEIEYEQIMGTYIQPVFVAVRDDKSPEDID